MPLRCRELCVAYAGVTVLTDLALDVRHGEVVALLGASGSGKSTLLNAVAGLVSVSSGEIWVDGHRVAGDHLSTPPEQRGVGMVFQNFALWPHLSVLDTVAYPLRRAGRSRRAAAEAATDAARPARHRAPRRAAARAAVRRRAAAGRSRPGPGSQRSAVPAGRADRAPGHPPAHGVPGVGPRPAARDRRRGRVRHPRRRRGARPRRSCRAHGRGRLDPDRRRRRWSTASRSAGRRRC